jgi:LacI family transcriptional regulator
MQFDNLSVEDPKLLYQQLADIIADKINSNEIAVGNKIPPERELCKTFGVSLDTVREALSTLVTKGYIARKRKLGTFVINSEPVKVADLKTRNEIASILCTDDNNNMAIDPYLLEIIRGIEEKINENGAHLIFKNLDVKNSELDFRKKEKAIAGMIVLGRVTPGHFRKIKKLKIPCVLIGDMYQKEKTNEEVDVICIDDLQGPYLATKHLTELGHRRIVFFMRNSGHFWDKDKIRGYRKALKEAGIDYNQNLLIEIKIGKRMLDDYVTGYRLMRKFLEKSLPFTGLVADSGDFTNGIFRAIKEKGINIPEDISVVGIRVPHTLTVVKRDLKGFGRKAVERLIYRINNPDCKPGRIIVPVELVIRNSTRRISSTHASKTSAFKPRTRANLRDSAKIAGELHKK